jgi:hypothetical protein
LFFTVEVGNGFFGESLKDIIHSWYHLDHHSEQCCGYRYGSRIRCFFTPSIRVRYELFLASDLRSGRFFGEISYIIFRILVMLSLWNWATLKSLFC